MRHGSAVVIIHLSRSHADCVQRQPGQPACQIASKQSHQVMAVLSIYMPFRLSRSHHEPYTQTQRVSVPLHTVRSFSRTPAHLPSILTCCCSGTTVAVGFGARFASPGAPAARVGCSSGVDPERGRNSLSIFDPAVRVAEARAGAGGKLARALCDTCSSSLSESSRHGISSSASTSCNNVVVVVVVTAAPLAALVEALDTAPGCACSGRPGSPFFMVFSVLALVLDVDTPLWRVGSGRQMLSLQPTPSLRYGMLSLVTAT